MCELCVLCKNNRNRQVTSEMLDTVEAVFNKDKPVLIVTHILPIEQELWTELLENTFAPAFQGNVGVVEVY